MGLEARELLAAPEAASSSTRAAALVTPVMFWVLLGFAVVLLLGLIARLVVNR